MTSSISGVSLLKEFCLNVRIYNIPGKIRDKCMREKDRGGNEVPQVRDCR